MTQSLPDGFASLSLEHFIWATLLMFLVLLAIAVVQMWRESSEESEEKGKR